MEDLTEVFTPNICPMVFNIGLASQSSFLPILVSLAIEVAATPPIVLSKSFIDFLKDLDIAPLRPDWRIAPIGLAANMAIMFTSSPPILSISKIPPVFSLTTFLVFLEISFPYSLKSNTPLESIKSSIVILFDGLSSSFCLRPYKLRVISVDSFR